MRDSVRDDEPSFCIRIRGGGRDEQKSAAGLTLGSPHRSCSFLSVPTALPVCSEIRDEAKGCGMAEDGNWIVCPTDDTGISCCQWVERTCVSAAAVAVRVSCSQTTGTTHLLLASHRVRLRNSDEE